MVQRARAPRSFQNTLLRGHGTESKRLLRSTNWNLYVCVQLLLPVRSIHHSQISISFHPSLNFFSIFVVMISSPLPGGPSVVERTGASSHLMRLLSYHVCL